MSPLLNLGIEGGVYFLLNPETGLVKIGCTRHFGRRIKELEEETGQTLIFLAGVDGDLHDERALHAKFEDDRAVGEWFRPGYALLRHIAQAQGRCRLPRVTVKRTKPSAPPVRRVYPGRFSARSVALGAATPTEALEAEEGAA